MYINFSALISHENGRVCVGVVGVGVGTWGGGGWDGLVGGVGVGGIRLIHDVKKYSATL